MVEIGQNYNFLVRSYPMSEINGRVSQVVYRKSVEHLIPSCSVNYKRIVG